MRRYSINTDSYTSGTFFYSSACIETGNLIEKRGVIFRGALAVLKHYMVEQTLYLD